jgi:hypothetical protein
MSVDRQHQPLLRDHDHAQWPDCHVRIQVSWY